MINEGGTVTFIAKASGKTDKKELVYLWEKEGRNKLPDKVVGSRNTMLSIPNLKKADEGEYSCTVTNEWGNSVRSGYVTLTVQGNKTYRYVMSVYICILCLHM